MSDTKVIGLVSKQQREQTEYDNNLLSVVDQFRTLVESGQAREFVIASSDEYGEIMTTICSSNYLSAIGLFEMGKNTLILQKSFENEIE